MPSRLERPREAIAAPGADAGRQVADAGDVGIALLGTRAQLRAEADAGRHHDRDGGGSAACHCRRGRSGGHKHVHLETDQLRHCAGEAVGAPLGPAEIERDAFAMSQFMQAAFENIPQRHALRIGRGGFENADASCFVI